MASVPVPSEQLLRTRSGPTSTSLNDSRLSLSVISTPTTAAAVNVTPLSRLPGHRVLHHLGPLTIHLIKETNAVREAGGVHNFVQLFISEVRRRLPACCVDRDREACSAPAPIPLPRPFPGSGHGAFPSALPWR